MKAAVLHVFGDAPRYEDFADPAAQEGEVIVHVHAASLKHIDRMMASGSHYSLTRPVASAGRRRWRGGVGRWETCSVPRAWVMPLPRGLDDLTAALPNPAMSSYLPLVWRVQFQPGEAVVVLGATGAAGQLVMQIAKQLGAGRVVAMGRNEAVLRRLAALGADVTISLNQEDEALVAAFARENSVAPFDVILDYVWGHPTEVLLKALTGDAVMGEPHRIRHVHIGEMAGPTITLPGAAQRSTALEMYGSGGGSLPPRAIVESFPKVLGWAAQGLLRMETERVPLSAVESVWRRGEIDGRRIVFVP